MLYIGIDIHKRSHEVAIIDDIGRPRTKSFKITNSKDGINSLLERIQTFNPANEPLRFGMEATGHYWMALYSHMTAAGYELVVINPLRTRAFRTRSVRPVKNDRIDAHCIAEVIRAEPASDPFLTDEQLLALRQLTRLRVETVDQIADQKRRLLALLDQAFPEFEAFFAQKYGKTALALLQAYPTPADILVVSVEVLTELLEKHSRKQIGRARAEEIKRAAEQSFGVLLGQKALGVQIRILAGQISYMEAQMKQLEGEIERYLNVVPHYLTTISGIGKVLAAAIMGEIGDIRRFKNAKALVAYAGMDPHVFQSGEFTAKHAHLSKRGSTHLRRAVWLAATAATRSDPALKVLHRKKMDEGKAYHVAMGAVANKMLHIIYAVLRDNKPYYCALTPEPSPVA